MRRYECTFIINPDKENEVKQIIEEVKNQLEGEKGKIEKIDEWGIRKLAYEIDGYDKGFYTVINFEAKPDKVNDFKEYMRKNSNILRYILLTQKR
ncbi:MAG: 30S ribosomal protein S6 [candidate division WOR-3 bacterium]